jgi:hypothetical protein
MVTPYVRRTGGTQMALLIIEHVVGDYETFEKVFLDDEARRRRLGSKGARVYRVAGDPNNVRVVLEFETADQARRHAEGLELHEAIKWATGNVSMPSFVVLEQVMTTGA